jgi:hypothetical protein
VTTPQAAGVNPAAQETTNVRDHYLIGTKLEYGGEFW